MTDWLAETLLWTALLIAFVLLVRRPVARMFGPQVAYALWALPALRFIMPPIELPAWMRPHEEATPAEQPVVASTPVDVFAPVVQDTMSAAPFAAPAEQPALAATFDWSWLGNAAIAVWLVGAVIFMALRFSAYFRLRDELLLDAREVGRDGKIRLIETPVTLAPLAFGVIDKVVALPVGFLAQPDRQARDLALAHELAHHRGRDLLVNVLVQPLFAIHWWNPLSRYGWLALRRDQEAACDARVMAQSEAEEREVYANLIVSFAAGPNVALAAPMACPVLGEKSIIHRLRSLRMDNTSKSRRFAGRIMVGAAVIALPMTASISYAASEAPLPPAAPEVPILQFAPQAPQTPPAAPVPPEAPEVLEAPEALVDEDAIIVVDPDVDVDVDVDVARDEMRVGRVFVTKDKDVDIRVVPASSRRIHRISNRRLFYTDGSMSEEEREKIIAEVRESLAEANRTLEEVPEIIENALEQSENWENRTKVVMRCKGDSDEVAHTVESDDGSATIYLCQARVMKHALTGLREARKSIAKNEAMSRELRKDLLEELDEQIENWEHQEAR